MVEPLRKTRSAGYPISDGSESPRISLAVDAIQEDAIPAAAKSLPIEAIQEDSILEESSAFSFGQALISTPFTPSCASTQRGPPPVPMPLRRSVTAPASLDVRCHRGKVGRAIGKCNISSLVSAEADGQGIWMEQEVSLLERPEERAFVAAEVRKSSVCRLLEESQIDRIVDNMKCFKFVAGQTLVRQGDVGKYFFILREGQLAVLSNNGSTSCPQRRAMKPGESSGEDALLFGNQQPATILAKEDSSVWALEGNTFRKVVNENSSEQDAENFHLLESLNIFEGCSQQQKHDLFKKFNLFTEVVPAGTIVVEEGQEVSSIYLVKEGELGILVTEPESGERQKVKTLYAGQSIAKQAALHSRPARVTVMAETTCKLVRIGIEQLRAELGPNLEAAIQTSILINRLDLSPFLSQFTLTQRRHIVDAMVITDYEPRTDVAETLEFVVVLKGSLRRKSDSEDDKDYLTASDVRESRSLLTSPELISRKSTRKNSFMTHQSSSLADVVALSDLVAGEHGARIATLTQGCLAEALEKAGISSKTVDVIEHAKRMLLAKRIHLFLPLSSEQVDMLIDSIIVVRYLKGDVVCEQGASATDFWIIAQGEADSFRDGVFQRTYRKHGQIGVRAMLDGTPRDGTVSVSSRSADLWQLGRETFDSIITGKAREDLVRHYELTDTGVELRDLKHVCLIGSGGFGSVRQVQHLRYPQLKYALKRVRKNLGEQVVDMVSRECKLLAETADHPLILLQVKTFETSASMYNLTELLEGGELLNALNQIGRPLTREEAQFYGGSLVLVLEELADRRIIFRDLKPENVMLDAQGYIKLIDFGSAKKLEGTEARTFTVIGSYHFMAPEVALGQGYGLEADAWSLGVMIFEFVCGHLPFGHDKTSPVEICTAVKTQNLNFPKWYRDNIGKHLMRGMLRREPSERLGHGVNDIEGIEQLKGHDYFKQEDDGEEGDLFQRILARRLPPPYMPQGNEYLQFEGSEGALSDAGELGG